MDLGSPPLVQINSPEEASTFPILGYLEGKEPPFPPGFSTQSHLPPGGSSRLTSWNPALSLPLSCLFSPAAQAGRG